MLHIIVEPNRVLRVTKKRHEMGLLDCPSREETNWRSKSLDNFDTHRFNLIFMNKLLLQLFRCTKFKPDNSNERNNLENDFKL